MSLLLSVAFDFFFLFHYKGNFFLIVFNIVVVLVVSEERARIDIKTVVYNKIWVYFFACFWRVFVLFFVFVSCVWGGVRRFAVVKEFVVNIVGHGQISVVFLRLCYRGCIGFVLGKGDTSSTFEGVGVRGCKKYY